jgi:hypothetical protein
MKPRMKRWILTMTAACAAASCGDGASTEPRAVVTDRPTFDVTATGDVVRLLKRDDALPSGLTATGVISPRGGHLEIAQAGFRIDFPAGAVSRPTRITVTAIGGRNVAYRFEPHGIAFNVPAVIRQSLRNTTAWKNPALAAELQGSYFERLLVDPTETWARTFEKRSARLRESAKMLEFTIEHFSGYLLSTGKSNLPVEVDIDLDITSR